MQSWSVTCLEVHMFVLFHSEVGIQFPKKVRFFWRLCQHFILIWNKKLNDGTIWRKAIHFWISSWNPHRPGHGRNIAPAMLQSDRCQQSWTLKLIKLEVKTMIFLLHLGFMLFVQAASWSHLSELFQATLEHVLKQSLEVILSALWSTDILGKQCRK